MKLILGVSFIMLTCVSMGGCDSSEPPTRRDSDGNINYGSGDHNIDFSDEDLNILLRDYPIREVVDAEKTELQKIVALASWVSSQWVKGVNMDKFLDPERRKNAVEILKKAHMGGHFNCLYYATVYSTCGIALDFRARRVCINQHVVSEFWSNDFNKWIVVDADFDLHFETDGVPMSAYEVHMAVVNNKTSNVTMVHHGRPPRLAKDVKENSPEWDQWVKKIKAQQFKFYSLLKFYY